MTARGQLRVYLGAAPGVGKTYKMLEEGHRRRDRGTDVVIGFVESHGRRHTEALVGGLEVVPRQHAHLPRRRRSPRWTSTPCSPARPQVALVDELAHTNVPGSRNAKRWQDIQQLLDAGHHRDHHGQHPAPRVAQRRRRRRSPACRSGRPCPTRWSAGPSRSSWST